VPEFGFTGFRTASTVAAALQRAGWELTVGPRAMDGGARRGVPSEQEFDAAYVDDMRS